MSVDLPSFNVLSLCSGAGGLDLGLKLAIPTTRTVGYVEIEAYACEVLASRMEEGTLDAAPLWTNLKTFDGRPWCGSVDCLIGGYPCQPFSVAGKRRGADDPRHLWPYIGGQIEGRVNLITQLGFPPIVFFENVANHLRMGFRDVRADLRSMGYRVAAGLFTAEEIGYPHKRERLFILGVGLADSYSPIWCPDCREPNTEPDGQYDLAGSSRDVGPAHAERSRWIQGSTGSTFDTGSESESRRLPLVNTNIPRLQRWEQRSGEMQQGSQFPAWPPSPSDRSRWLRVLRERPDLAPATSRSEEIAFAGATTESEIRRVVNGLAHRMDRLRLCGNGVVPDVAAYAFTTLYKSLCG